MLDSFNREINYLRISVTDRCNLRCVYCMPEEGIMKKSHHQILTYEEIYSVVKEAAELGIKKVRLTGGEPLVRKNIDELVAMIRSIEKIETIAMTTNAVMLYDIAKRLKEAGLNSINISLDTLDSERYKYITRGGSLYDAMKGIKKASELGFQLKINVVIYDDKTKEELALINEYASNLNAKVQTIQYYNLNEQKLDAIDYDRPAKCKFCNRIRLLSDGYLLSCLHSNIKFKLDFNDIRSSIIKCIDYKPENGTYSDVESLSMIGG
ncbi:GTP 3',8-cyclase MoaA [Brachyspira sp.]|uniref:GTP 3',8-cyclase MoaA n=1 Tax=Brachyspira sp. TaxID=1977261 RepID=UPI0026389B5D|nr:radical SAM protein [Brachyspira sp.]